MFPNHVNRPLLCGLIRFHEAYFFAQNGNPSFVLVGRTIRRWTNLSESRIAETNRYLPKSVDSGSGQIRVTLEVGDAALVHVGSIARRRKTLFPHL